MITPRGIFSFGWNRDAKIGEIARKED